MLSFDSVAEPVPRLPRGCASGLVFLLMSDSWPVVVGSPDAFSGAPSSGEPGFEGWSLLAFELEAELDPPIPNGAHDESDKTNSDNKKYRDDTITN